LNNLSKERLGGASADHHFNFMVCETSPYQPRNVEAYPFTAASERHQPRRNKMQLYRTPLRSILLTCVTFLAVSQLPSALSTGSRIRSENMIGEFNGQPADSSLGGACSPAGAYRCAKSRSGPTAMVSLL